MAAGIVDWDNFSYFLFFRQRRDSEGFLKNKIKILETPLILPDNEGHSYGTGA